MWLNVEKDAEWSGSGPLLGSTLQFNWKNQRKLKTSGPIFELGTSHKSKQESQSLDGNVQDILVTNSTPSCYEGVQVISINKYLVKQ